MGVRSLTTYFEFLFGKSSGISAAKPLLNEKKRIKDYSLSTPNALLLALGHRIVLQ